MAQPIMPRAPVPLEPGHTIAAGMATLSYALVLAPPPAGYGIGVLAVLLIGTGLWDLRNPRRKRRNPRRVVAELDRERRRAERRGE